MRVIAGRLGGRLFDSPRGHRTHPMSDRVRGALFNVLGDISGLSVLDAFAGSGALSFEAVSRGAASALAIDADKQAYLAIVANIQALALAPAVRAVHATVSGWSANNGSQTFDIVLADPPYDDLRQALIARLAEHAKPGSWLVLSWPGGQTAPELPRLTVRKTKSYGDAQLIFYQKDS